MEKKTFEEEIPPDLVSDFLIIKCREMGDVITNLKLQKLLYYAQAWYLAEKDKPIFSEDFQAWISGPVLPSQYHRFKKYEWRPILEEDLKIAINNPSIINHLDEVVDCFGVETAASLEKMTHNELPWQEARTGIPKEMSSNNIIKKESVDLFYKSFK